LACHPELAVTNVTAILNLFQGLLFQFFLVIRHPELVIAAGYHHPELVSGSRFSGSLFSISLFNPKNTKIKDPTPLRIPLLTLYVVSIKFATSA